MVVFFRQIKILIFLSRSASFSFLKTFNSTSYEFILDNLSNIYLYSENRQRSVKDYHYSLNIIFILINLLSTGLTLTTIDKNLIGTKKNGILLFRISTNSLFPQNSRKEIELNLQKNDYFRQTKDKNFSHNKNVAILEKLSSFKLL